MDVKSNALAQYKHLDRRARRMHAYFGLRPWTRRRIVMTMDVDVALDLDTGKFPFSVMAVQLGQRTEA